MVQEEVEDCYQDEIIQECGHLHPVIWMLDLGLISHALEAPSGFYYGMCVGDSQF